MRFLNRERFDAILYHLFHGRSELFVCFISLGATAEVVVAVAIILRTREMEIPWRLAGILLCVCQENEPKNTKTLPIIGDA